MYVVTLADGVGTDRVARAMEEEGVPVRRCFSPVNAQSYLRWRFGYKGVELPVTDGIAQHTLALPFHNNLTEVQADRVVDVLARAT